MSIEIFAIVQTLPNFPSNNFRKCSLTEILNGLQECRSQVAYEVFCFDRNIQYNIQYTTELWTKQISRNPCGVGNFKAAKIFSRAQVRAKFYSSIVRDRKHWMTFCDSLSSSRNVRTKITQRFSSGNGKQTFYVQFKAWIFRFVEAERRFSLDKPPFAPYAQWMKENYKLWDSTVPIFVIITFSFHIFFWDNPKIPENQKSFYGNRHFGGQ